MNYYFIFGLIFIYIQGSIGAPFRVNLCDDWVEYKKEKCFKVLNMSGTEEEGEQYCTKLDMRATLVNITDAEQQQFLMNYLSNYSGVAERVWTGVYSDVKSVKVIRQPIDDLDIYEVNDDDPDWEPDYQRVPQMIEEHSWQVDSNVYTNWAVGSPDSIDWYQKGRRVQISITRNTFGKWFDESKRKVGLIACERRQEWTIGVLSTSLQNVAEVLNRQQKMILDQRERLDLFESKVNSIIDNENQGDCQDENQTLTTLA